MTPEDFIQQYEDYAQGSDVLSLAEVCRNDCTQLEEHQQDQISVQVGYALQELLTSEETKNASYFNNVLEE